jgi:hypothetical protein
LPQQKHSLIPRSKVKLISLEDTYKQRSTQVKVLTVEHARRDLQELNTVTIQLHLPSGAAIEEIPRLLIAKITCQMWCAHPLYRRLANYSQLIAVVLPAQELAGQPQMMSLQLASGTR